MNNDYEGMLVIISGAMSIIMIVYMMVVTVEY